VGNPIIGGKRLGLRSDGSAAVLSPKMRWTRQEYGRYTGNICRQRNQGRRNSHGNAASTKGQTGRNASPCLSDLGTLAAYPVPHRGQSTITAKIDRPAIWSSTRSRPLQSRSFPQLRLHPPPFGDRQAPTRVLSAVTNVTPPRAYFSKAIGPKEARPSQARDRGFKVDLTVFAPVSRFRRHLRDPEPAAPKRIYNPRPGLNDIFSLVEALIWAQSQPR
jgi:hypothetical protein